MADVYKRSRFITPGDFRINRNVLKIWSIVFEIFSHGKFWMSSAFEISFTRGKWVSRAHLYRCRDEEKNCVGIV
jgi:hypothetical protein